MNLKDLAAPFEPSDIEWRIGQCGIGDGGKIWVKCLAYITNRAIMNRLDEVCGPENWKNEFQRWGDASQLCGISIKIDGEWVTKWDGADETQIESTKGGLSDAQKRSAVQWGIGRYLYKLEEGWADVSPDRKDGFKWANANVAKDKKKDKDYRNFYWKPPALPKWALPGNKPATAPPPREEPAVADLSKSVDILLQNYIGCNNSEEASKVLIWLSGGEYSNPTQYRSTPADAKAVHDMIKERENTVPLADMLAAANKARAEVTL